MASNISLPLGTTARLRFAGLALRPELLQALTSLGYEEPTPIQREAIPSLLAGRDLLTVGERLGDPHGVVAAVRVRFAEAAA